MSLRVTVFLLAAAWLAAGCKQRSPQPAGDAGQAEPSATARVVVEDFKPLDPCSCPGFKVEYRVVREEDDPKLEPARRHNMSAEFRISGGGKDWVFKPAPECAFPQKMYANTLKLGVACTPNRLVIAGPHWASAFSVGRESWTRRIDSDPTLPDDLQRPMLKPAGVGAPQWGEPERADPAKLKISCEPLTVDQNYVQIADWGGNVAWYEVVTGRQR